MASKVFIVVPAYNEEKTISSVISGLKAEGYRNIVVIDDGSKDRTRELAKRARVTVLSHKVNRGQGAALRTGIDYALKQKANMVVTFDSDGQHNPKDVGALLSALDKGVDVALGSRFLKRHKVPVVRKIFLKGGALSFRVFYKVKLTDSHNGLRALTRDAAKKIEIKNDDMAHASEIIDSISKNKLRYKEVPVDIVYTDYSRRKGQKTINAFRIMSRMISKKVGDSLERKK